ncbi:uncharacterized protein LOC129588428 [Paramacrobiotus metropolitanus]|uniref:uncharacterized protein LOC129588428 n=1 Tax=Paramacrobiotus metropolitanus TaxID=2943436 RepID=UPI00244614D5|nr:uncharacterized protein LOC129588428 [Paramacrobiotus metropolitanus]
MACAVESDGVYKDRNILFSVPFFTQNATQIASLNKALTPKGVNTWSITPQLQSIKQNLDQYTSESDMISSASSDIWDAGATGDACALTLDIEKLSPKSALDDASSTTRWCISL